MPHIDDELLDTLMSLQSAVERVERVTRGRDLPEMMEHELVQLGITKAVEQVGEICGRIIRKHPEFAAAHPALEFKPAYDAWNRMAHGYESLDFEAVWFSATVSVMRMGQELARVMADLDDRP